LEEAVNKALFAIVVLMPVLSWAKPKPADYAITVHVQSSHVVSWCNDILGHANCDTKQHLSVIIDGKKYELDSYGDYDSMLRTGDYKAKLLPDEQRVGDIPLGTYEYRRKYEFLFPDGKTRKYSVVGESE
jgi:hypothetical protein